MPDNAAETPLRIFTRNFIDSNSTITLSHGGTAARLYDRDKEAKYATSGANRDTISAQIDITFMSGGVETEFTFSALLLLNTNLKELRFQKYVSGAYVDILSVGENSESVICKTFGAVKTSRVRLIMPNTIQPNKEKQIGQLIIARQRFFINDAMWTYDMLGREKTRRLEMGNGELHIAHTLFAPTRTQRYGARVGWQLASIETLNVIRCLKDEGIPFLWYPESITKPDEIWYVYISSPPAVKYTIHNKLAGYDISLELQEV